MKMTLEERYALLDHPNASRATINGEPASIGGVRCDFMGVRSIRNHALNGIYSDDTIKRVLDAGGAFKA